MQWAPLKVRVVLQKNAGRSLRGRCAESGSPAAWSRNKGPPVSSVWETAEERIPTPSLRMCPLNTWSKTHTERINIAHTQGCLFLCNCVTFAFKCTWRFMFMHRWLRSMSDGMVIWFLICFRLFHARLLEILNNRYQRRNGNNASVCLRVCGSVHACPFSGHGSGGLWDVWSEILNATDFYACTINQLFTIHTSGNHSVSLICSLSLSLFASFFPVTQYLSALLCLFLCVWPSSTDHTHQWDTFKVIFLEDCHGVDNSVFMCECGLMEMLEMVRNVLPLD